MTKQIDAVAESRRTAFWRRRRYQAVGIGVALMVLTLFGANLYLSKHYQPEAALTQYLSAIQSGDAQAAWSVVQLSAPSAPVAASLTDAAALRAALAAGRPDLKNFAVTDVHLTDADGTRAAIDVSFDTSTGTEQTKFKLLSAAEKQFGIYPTWRVMIEPTLLKVTLPAGAGTVVVDGKSLSLGAGPSTIAVWPLAHKVAFPGTAMLSAQTVSLDEFAATTDSVDYKPRLTTAGTVASTSAVKAAFDSCARQVSAQPDGCPQHFDDPTISTGTWQLVGDPTQDLEVSFDDNQQLQAKGHFQMVFGYPLSDGQGTQHQPSSGPFVADLVLGADNVTVGTIQATSAGAALTRPNAATDQAALVAVSKALAGCVRGHGSIVADCPQWYFNPGASQYNWTLKGDPTRGATVAFDSNLDLYSIHGSFAMIAAYDSYGYADSSASSTDFYTALLFWDGQQFQVVTITGGYV